METVRELIPLLIPLLILQLVLVGAALIDLARRPATRGPRWVWVLIILLVNTVGPILYFVLGREDD